MAEEQTHSLEEISIAPGEAAHLTVRSLFSTGGTKNGTLRIASNEPDEPSYALPLAFNPTLRPAPLA